MTFDPTVPSSGSKINAQFMQLRQNFATSNSLYGLDHYSWNDFTVSNRGLHRLVTLIGQVIAPSQLATAGRIYTQNNVATIPAVTRIDPYYKFDNGSLGIGLSAPVIPFKVFAAFDANQNTSTSSAVIPGSQIYQSFNVNSISYIDSSFSPSLNLRTFTVSFINNLDNQVAGSSANYIALVSQSTPSPASIVPSIFYSQNHKNNSIQIVIFQGLIPSSVIISQVSFGIITL